ncbi:hypothetical protein [Cardinium endosymbiont of Tipula unca]|uniref:hypothetical protein n=1 Tax=Cardinium endosymbiont of Tipula unca TaxID=3066216 RepID=UPI0030D2DAA6
MHTVPVFAEDVLLHQQEQHRFFEKNEAMSLHFGLKIWAKATKKMIKQSWASGLEVSIGPFLDWRPLNGIGLQTGIFYSCNYLYMIGVSVNGKMVSDTGMVSFFSNAFNQISNLDLTNNDRFGVTLDRVHLHTLSFPLHLRLYPEKTRQLVLYGGPRLIVALHATEKEPLFALSADANKIWYHTVKQGILGGVKELFSRDITDASSLSGKLFSCAWDVGFEYNGNAGFIIGINGLGIVLGYDCTYLFAL